MIWSIKNIFPVYTTGHEIYVMEPIKINSHFIKDLIEAHGTINAIELLKLSFGVNINKKITSNKVQLMVWQLTHSMDILKELVPTITDSNSIKELHNNDNKTISTISKHITCSLDAIEDYFK